jgi:hypothetical protein
MNKTWTLLTLLLLLCVGPAMAAPAAPMTQTPVQCVGDTLSSIFSANTQTSAPASLSGPAPVNQDQPICQVTCVTTQCSSNADCTAAPNGHCNFACPGVGCCVYQ